MLADIASRWVTGLGAGPWLKREDHSAVDAVTAPRIKVSCRTFISMPTTRAQTSAGLPCVIAALQKSSGDQSSCTSKEEDSGWKGSKAKDPACGPRASDSCGVRALHHPRTSGGWLVFAWLRFDALCSILCCAAVMMHCWSSLHRQGGFYTTLPHTWRAAEA